MLHRLPHWIFGPLERLRARGRRPERRLPVRARPRRGDATRSGSTTAPPTRRSASRRRSSTICSRPCSASRPNPACSASGSGLEQAVLLRGGALLDAALLQRLLRRLLAAPSSASADLSLSTPDCRKRGVRARSTRAISLAQTADGALLRRPRGTRRPSARRRTGRPPGRGSPLGRGSPPGRRRRRPPRRRRRESPVCPVLDQLRHRAAPERDHRRAARHRLDDAVAERLVEPDRVQQRIGAAEQRRPLLGAHRADEGHPLTVEPRRDPLVEVLLVLDDPGDHERRPAASATSIASAVPLSGWIRPKKSR